MEQTSLIARCAERFSVDPERFFEALKSTAFRQRDGTQPTNEQMLALLVVADQYGLNPFTREIYAFPDKTNGIVPVVGVDGWARIINQHTQFDGMTFEAAEKQVHPEGAKPCPEWMTCIIYRRDRQHPVQVTEYLDEVYRPPFISYKNGTVPGPWQSHTKRMLRHKTMIQCARVAFGFVGIFDPDEAERIVSVSPETTLTEPLLPSQQMTAVLPEAVIQADETLLPTESVCRLVRRLIERATAAGAWEGAAEYAREHFQGSDLQYALLQLAEAQQQL